MQIELLREAVRLLRRIEEQADQAASELSKQTRANEETRSLLQRMAESLSSIDRKADDGGRRGKL
jgi:hypothetical protein